MRPATERLVQVTVLNLGRTLAAGTPDEIRVHKKVVNAYLGG
jgi:ABC-type branched-subunit amino acid transport system ATPase component